VQWAALAVAKIARDPSLAMQLGICNCCQAITEVRASQRHNVFASLT
jgi:phosphoribosylformylglycinamidine (FGAM) synthase-like amidotransferase family enzyme